MGITKDWTNEDNNSSHSSNFLSKRWTMKSQSTSFRDMPKPHPDWFAIMYILLRFWEIVYYTSRTISQGDYGSTTIGIGQNCPAYINHLPCSFILYPFPTVWFVLLAVNTCSCEIWPNSLLKWVLGEVYQKVCCWVCISWKRDYNVANQYIVYPWSCIEKRWNSYRYALIEGAHFICNAIKLRAALFIGPSTYYLLCVNIYRLMFVKISRGWLSSHSPNKLYVACHSMHYHFLRSIICLGYYMY